MDPPTQENTKKLWSFIKSKETDNTGVSPLKKNGITYSDSNMKVNTLNVQFVSVVIKESGSFWPWVVSDWVVSAIFWGRSFRPR